MLVESKDTEGASVYEMIIKQIFQDLQLSPSVKDMRVFVNPDEVVFIIAIKMDKTASVIKLDEVANVEYNNENNKTIIRINNENYLPNILTKLWIDYGRENIYQPNRFILEIEGKIANLSSEIIYSPKDNLRRRVYDAIFRIIPEGFRIIRDLSTDDIVVIVCTDELIKDDWISKAETFIDELKDS